MEEILVQIQKESGSKHASLKQSCKDTQDVLQDRSLASTVEPYQLRERCLNSMQLAIESGNSKLALIGVNGIQKMLTDERFQSSMESECEDKWLPMQVLGAVTATASLPQEVQVEIMKMLLNMTMATTWCMNAKVITKITELCFTTYISTTKSSLRKAILSTLLRILGVFYQRHRIHYKDPKSKEVVTVVYGASSPGSVRTAVKATLTQLLSAVAEKLRQKQALQKEDADSVIAEFTSNESVGDTVALAQDVVSILQYLCQKLACSQTSAGPMNTEPLLLEAIYSVLYNVPITLRDNEQFIDLVWQNLCPSLICALGNPVADKSVMSQKGGTSDEVGRGSGCSGTAPSVLSSSAKTIYNISVELVRLVGCVQSLRPVLESLFHRMLLYPPPEHRLHNLKAMKELLEKPEMLVLMAGPTLPETVTKPCATSGKKKQYGDLSLLKLVIDAIQECCHCNESSVCITSVNLITDLLTSVEHLVKGQGLTDEQVRAIILKYGEFDGASVAGSVSASDVETLPDVQESADTVAMDSDLSDDQSDTSSTDSDDVIDVSQELEISSWDTSEQHQGSAARCGYMEKVRRRPLGPPPAVPKLHRAEEVEVKFKPVSTNGDQERVERECAKEYVESLVQCLPSLLASSSVMEADKLLQRFSSNVCSVLSERQNSSDGSQLTAILNADGVYVATYSALLLNLKLIQQGYYQSEEKSLPMSEDQFIEDILGTGLLLYLSRAWLSEVFLQVANNNLLRMGGFASCTAANLDLALVQLLTDVDGLGSRNVGGQMMSLYWQNDTAHDGSDNLTGEHSDAVQAGMKFAKRILTGCWDGILDVLSVLISGKSACGITNSFALMFNAQEESRKAREAICTSLDGLQKAARLACILGLHDRCGAVFTQLANASCVMEDMRQPDKKSGIPSVLPSRPKLAKMHAAHALSMDLVLSIGLEMSSHAGDCWKHVFRCCAHVSELEHTYFSGGSNQSNLPKVLQDQQQSLATETTDFEESDLYSSMVTAGEPVTPTIDVSDLVHSCSVGSSWESNVSGGGILSANHASKVLCGLSQHVDRLYEDAATKLNMKALVSYLAELCKASSHQLAPYGRTLELTGVPHKLPTNALHLYRLGDVTLKVVQSSRPLLHIMRVWSVVAPHLVEAACHRDRNISKKAVGCIHEVVTTMLSTQQELPHFHVNESLCKPFENLLCLELCDSDVQDQIVCSICELVEACTNEIRSGWRALFGALRAVRLEYTAIEDVNEARQRHIAAVLDVFDVFLNTDNTLVFANAAVDCIMCLLKYISGPGHSEDDDDYDSDSGSDMTAAAPEDLCLPALKYLKQCCCIMSSMWRMPACPNFHGAHRIKTDPVAPCVDDVIPGIDLPMFQKMFTEPQSTVNHVLKTDEVVPRLSPEIVNDPCLPEVGLDEKAVDIKSMDSGIGVIGQDGGVVTNGNTEDDLSAKEVTKSEAAEIKRSNSGAKEEATIEEESPDANAENKHQSFLSYTPKTLDELDNQTGILHVWFLVLEGLASTVSSCPKYYQPQTLEMLFDMLRSASDVPGPDFALYCVNHLLLPNLQSWLRRGRQLTGYWNQSCKANFKQCAGLCTDLVVEFLIQFGSGPGYEPALEYMLKQLLSILTECIAQPLEALSRLGCACIRHCLLSSGPTLTESMWHIGVTSLHSAFDVSLYSLRQLMTPFHANSDNFYGDIGSVKVAVRNDSSGLECERLRQLAQQVFLLDSQRGTTHVIDYEAEENRSFIFLLYPPKSPELNTELPPTRVPFQNIVVGLLSHQLLVQTVGSLLLQGSSHVVPSERGVLSSQLGAVGPSSDDKDMLLHDTPLPGMLRYLSCRNSLVLMNCLRDSQQTAARFDARPGLKFLIQKVVRAEVAANMYKQSAISLTFYIHTLLEIASRDENICLQHTKQVLLEKAKSIPRRTNTTGNVENGQIRATDNSDSAHLSQHNSSVLGENNLENYPDKDKSINSTHSASLEKNIGHNGVGSKVEDSRSNTVSTGVCNKTDMAAESQLSVLRHVDSFMWMLKEVFDEVCTSYVDLYLEREGPNAADRLSVQVLVFLVDQTEELPQLKRDKSLKEMLAEKLSKVKKDVDTSSEPVSFQAVPVQGDDDNQNDYGQSPSAVTSSPDDDKPRHAGDDRVYTVATDKTIRSLMSEYKKRKQAHSMPSFIKATRSRPLNPKKAKPPSGDPSQRQIEEEHKSSIMKDSEAHLNSWIEMICSVLQLFNQLEDYQYQALLPCLFSCINQLVCHCKARRLREVLAQWTHRIGHLYGFAPPGDLPPLTS